MKKSLVFLAMFGVGAAAQAQSSVTLYGAIDAGVTYTSNQQVAHPGGNMGGRSAVQATSGNTAASVFGLKGSEDLGGGNQVVFQLENGFNATTGRLGRNNTLFDRIATVGLASKHLGTLQVGRLYDSATDFVSPFSFSNTLGTQFASHPGDVDNLNQSFNLSNAIKYTSPDYYGLQFGGTYSLGGQPGSFSRNSAYSLGANYSLGGFSAGIGYLSVNNPMSAVYSVSKQGDSNDYTGAFDCTSGPGCALQNVRHMHMAALGAAYDFGAIKLGGVVSRTALNGNESTDQPYAGTDSRYDNYEVNAVYTANDQLKVGVAYTFTHAKMANKNGNINQVNLGGEYALSKRTALYSSLIYQAGQRGSFAQIANLPASSEDKQVAATVGVRHVF
ncbi:MAG: porin [Janthinobacterium lividum]